MTDWLTNHFASATLTTLDKVPFKPGKKQEGEPILKEFTQKMEAATGTVVFPLTFLMGTRMAKVRVKISMDIHAVHNGKTIPKTIKTSSDVVIVITNESQWEESEKTLIEYTAFGDGTATASWPLLCNVIQRHMTQEVKSSSDHHFRAFSQQDFDYFHLHFFNEKEVVSLQDFQGFWGWFGKAFQALKFQKHINVMWQYGYLPLS